jgi:hypothetical protein
VLRLNPLLPLPPREQFFGTHWGGGRGVQPLSDALVTAKGAADLVPKVTMDNNGSLQVLSSVSQGMAYQLSIMHVHLACSFPHCMFDMSSSVPVVFSRSQRTELPQLPGQVVAVALCDAWLDAPAQVPDSERAAP